MILIKERIGKLISDLEELIYSKKYPIGEYRMMKVEQRYHSIDEIDSSRWERMDARDIWGGHREFYYFETTFTVPADAAGKILIYELRTGREGDWDALNPQFLAYVNGQLRHGLDVNHREIRLTESAEEGEQFTILLSAFTGDNNFSLHLDSEVKVLVPEVEKYYYDLKVPYEVARLLDHDSDEYYTIIGSLNESLNRLDLRKPYSDMFFASLKEAQKYLDEEFYGRKCGNSKETVYCVGHTHIDVAWLWTLATTQDKAVRSFSTVLDLMKQYPEYKFMSSQPQLYKYVQKNAPEVFEEIRKRVAEGRWEAEGGMFLEADCNLASGESLIRQFLYGTRFFEKEFRKKNRILWLPDVFGYSAALPQIMKKCGIRYFMTTKISWNEFNKMPYDTFMWEGIDGTKILTHFIPARDYGTGAKEGSAETEHFTTYNAMLNPSQVMGSWQRYSQKYLNSEVLISYGYGDGGGGPTKEMLENQRRLAKGIPGSPKTVQSHALEFFQKLENSVKGNKYLPKWVGELYLEYHRGTYTSMARNKKYNRKSEFMAENLEFYAVLAEKLLGDAYPREELADIWEVILRNQFHDILPGSCIREVYEDSKAEYEGIIGKMKALTDKTLQKLADNVEGAPGDLVIFNPNGLAEKSVVRLPVNLVKTGGAADADDAESLILTDGTEKYPLQKTEDGMIAVLSGMPARGWKVLKVKQQDDKSDDTGVKAEEKDFSVTSSVVETPYFHVEINERGQFTGIYDKKAGREIIPEGKEANVLVTYEDRPHNFDAWDINNYYTEKSWRVEDVSSIEVTENGPVRGCIRITRHYLDSVIVQYIYFYRDLYQIDIRNEIDWKEDHILLRDYFPVDIHTDEARFEIQYGNVKRPTHYNTSWDFAKFEVCSHKWLDVSEGDYGVSFLNDCKYGYSVHDGVVGMSMLKSATYPNPDADKEHHSFWYGICPHSGDYTEGNTIAKAYMFNNPYRAVLKDKTGNGMKELESYVMSSASDVVVESVKMAEDSDDIILRCYEDSNRRVQTTLTFAFPVEKAVECTMLEEEENELPFCGNELELEFRPFEIKTIKIRPAASV